MDAAKCGALIRSLRREKGWTQAELARKIGVTDKAVSKWERALGCPDISLLDALSREFRVDMAALISGTLNESKKDGGNMNRLKFYLCPVCGSLLTSTGRSGVSCCGRQLSPLAPVPADEGHTPRVETVEDELYFTFDHPMTKEHYLSFAAWLEYDRVLLQKLYPEQDAAFRLPRMRRGKLFVYCVEHGLMQITM